MIKFVDYPKQYKSIKKEIDFAIQDVINRGDFILRKDVEEFEKKLAKYVGAKYAVGVASGTDALILSLKALNIGQGDEVITTGYTFWATIEAIIHNQAIPVLVDIGQDLLMDTEQIEQRITPQTKAIIPVHIGGAVCEMNKICELALKYNLKIIEDTAQGLGGKYKEQMAGSIGDLGAFSFYPAKILGCYGDGGAITTNNLGLYEKLKMLRNHGRKSKDEMLFAGFSSRLDNLQAAILNVKLKYLPFYIKRRQEIAKMYNTGLKDVKFLRFPKSQTYQEYNLIAERRNELHQFLEEKGVETLMGIYKFPIYQPGKTILANQMVLRLPISPELTNEEINNVINAIKTFYQ